MNILCLDQFSNLGGGQRCLLDLLPGLTNRGWQVRVAIPDDGPFSSAVRRLGLPADILQCRSYSNGRKPLVEFAKYAFDFEKLARAIRCIVVTNRIDLLYVNGPRMLPPAALVARFYSIPIILHCHSRLFQRSAISVAGICLRAAKANVIACCAFAAGPIRPYVNPGRLSIVYNGVAGFREKCGTSPAPPRRIGVIGRIEREKGQLEFIRAARLVLNRFPDAQFSVIGSPLFSGSSYLEEVVDSARDLPVAFTGWRDDMQAVFSNLDLLVVPSTQVDSTPRVILEAFAAGVPVVAFPSGGIPEILDDGKTGFLTPAATPDALAVKITSILAMPREQLNGIIDRARQAWQDNFTVERYRRQITEIISQVLAGAEPVPARPLNDGRQESVQVVRRSG